MSTDQPTQPTADQGFALPEEAAQAMADFKNDYATKAVADSIYIASKTKHAKKWLALRQQGVNFISSWIDEWEKGASKCLKGLSTRCIDEPMAASKTIVYAEDDDVLKGAFIEMGAALAGGKPVVIVGQPLKENSAFAAHPLVYFVNTIEEAIAFKGEAQLQQPNQKEG